MDVALVAGSVRWNGTLAVCWLPIKGKHKQKYVSHVDAMSTSPWNIPIYPGSDAYALAHIGTIQPYRTDPWRQGTSSPRYISSLQRSTCQRPRGRSWLLNSKRGASCSQWPGALPSEKQAALTACSRPVARAEKEPPARPSFAGPSRWHSSLYCHLILDRFFISADTVLLDLPLSPPVSPPRPVVVTPQAC